MAVVVVEEVIVSWTGVVSAVVVDFVLMASMAMGVGRLYVDSGSRA